MANLGWGTSRGTKAAATKMAEPGMVPAVIVVTSYNPSALARPTVFGWVMT
jgi:hypothetical protein